jgi:hypothetical protein
MLDMIYNRQDLCSLEETGESFCMYFKFCHDTLPVLQERY